MVTEKEIREALEAHGITVEQLTPEELLSLKKEIEEQKNGVVILDGVLSNPEIRYRKPSI